LVDIEAMLASRHIIVHRGPVAPPYWAIYNKGADILQPNVLTLSDSIKFSPEEERELLADGIAYNKSFSRFDQASWFGFQLDGCLSFNQKELQRIAAETLIELEELSALLAQQKLGQPLGVKDLANIFMCREELILVRMSCPDVSRLWSQKDDNFKPVMLHTENNPSRPN
jgi:hypothetical protein